MDILDASQNQNTDSGNNTSVPVPDLSALMDTTDSTTQSTTQMNSSSATTNPTPIADDPPNSSVPNNSPPPKKMNKGILIAVILFFLISLPILGVVINQQRQLADTRGRAYPGEVCTTGAASCLGSTDGTPCGGNGGYCQGNGSGLCGCVSMTITPSPTPINQCNIPNPVSPSSGYCDRDALVVDGRANGNCTDKPEFSGCTTIIECGSKQGVCRVVNNGAVSECTCVAGGGGGTTPSKTPTPAGCPNPNGGTHRECQSGSCVTVNNAPGVCDNEDNNTCDTNNQCTSGGATNTPPPPTNTPTRTPTPTTGPSATPNPSGTPTNTPVPPSNTPTMTPVLGECQNIKVYKNGVVVNPNTLMKNDQIVIAVVGTNATQARIKINNETNWRVSTNTNSSGEWIFDYTIPNDGTITFSITAELFISGVWQ